jgi:hypothetical protein
MQRVRLLALGWGVYEGAAHKGPNKQFTDLL